jgi:DNA-binding winged helix-turn-helix (wHTH) protein
MNGPNRAEQNKYEGDVGTSDRPSFRLDAASGTMWRGAVPLTIRPKTAAVLRHLVDRAGAVVSSDELRDVVWGRRYGNENGPKQCIRELRVLLDDPATTPRFIETVGRNGYRFVGDATVITDGQSETGPMVAAPFAVVPTCVGRDHELNELAAGLARAQRGGRSIYFIAGETGVGKTTLIDNFLSRLGRRHDLWIARGQCVPHHGPRDPYAPLLDMAEHLAAGPAGRDFVQLIRNHAPAWLTQLPSIFGVREVVDKQVELAGAGPERMLRELIDIIERLTQPRPGIIVLEDLQWSDASTLGWISAWALRRAPARLMFLATYRVEDERGGGNQALATTLREMQRRPGFRRLELDGLSADAVGQYLDGRFSRHRSPSQLAISLARRTEGHPIFVVAMIEEWLARGELHRSEGWWALRGDVAELAETVPASARALIEHQVARLSSAERRVLEAASVVGEEFSAATLGSGTADTEAAEQQCEELARRRLFIQHVGTMTWPDGTAAASYRFWHALYRQVIYERLPAATRGGFHRRVGARLEAAYGVRARDIAAVLAEHFEQGRDHRRAALYFRQAGERALKLGAAQEATEHLRRALALIARFASNRRRSEDELQAQMSLGAALILAEGFTSPRVAAAYGRARTLAGRVPRFQHLIPLLCGLWNYHIVRGDFRRANPLAQRLGSLAESETDPSMKIAALNAVGWTRWFTGEFAAARACIDASANLYDVRAHRHVSALLGEDPGVAYRMYAAMTLLLLGFPDEAERHVAAGQEIARTINQPLGKAEMLWIGTMAAREAGDTALAEARALSLLKLSEAENLKFWLLPGLTLAGGIAAMRGDKSALDMLREVTQRLPERPVAFTRPYLIAIRAEAYFRHSMFSEARAALTEAFDLVRKTGERWYQAGLHRLAGEIALQLGHGKSDRLDAIGHLTEAVRTARRQTAKLLELRAAVSLARQLECRGERRRAQQMLTPLCEWFPENSAMPPILEARSILAPDG